MPNKKSAERRVRVAERNRLYNRYWTTRCKTAVKKVLDAVDAGDQTAAAQSFNLAQSVIDKAVVKGVMHRNTASHRKELMARRLKSLKAPEGAEGAGA
ncbi:MAG: 30S ribosomal protein S20 [Synergistaceae bacterium]|nr:30S ribosomal protein S20 [Synergistaceae bacterium]